MYGPYIGLRPISSTRPVNFSKDPETMHFPYLAKFGLPRFYDHEVRTVLHSTIRNFLSRYQFPKIHFQQIPPRFPRPLTMGCTPLCGPWFQLVDHRSVFKIFETFHFSHFLRYEVLHLLMHWIEQPHFFSYFSRITTYFLLKHSISMLNVYRRVILCSINVYIFNDMLMALIPEE